MMLVVKRNGRTENVSFDKIYKRIEDLAKMAGYELSHNLNIHTVCKKTIELMTDSISTELLDKLSANICGDLITINYDYSKLGARILISNLLKNLKTREHVNTFSELTALINERVPNYLNDNYLAYVKHNAATLDKMINNDYNYLFDFFGFKTLENSYLIKDTLKKETLETPQALWMRVAIAIHMNIDDMNNLENLEQIKTNYNYFGQGLFTHATPTLFNAGTIKQQMSSCYLLGTDDSIEGIFKTITDCAHISKWAGGIGVHISNIRSRGQLIKKTNGESSGIVPMMKLLNETGKYINQCFTPDTWVYSYDGPKQMQDITKNDYLITIDGSYKKVNEVIINDINTDILLIRSTNTLFPTYVTNEHQIYTLRNQHKLTKIDTIIKKLNEGTLVPEYISASELNLDDMVGFPIPTYEQDNNLHDINYYQFYGMMLGDGHMCCNRMECGITLEIEKKAELITFIQEYLTAKNIHYWTYNYNGCIAIKWTNIDELQLTRDMLYDEENKKRIYQPYLHLPKHKILKLLEGLLKTDGSNLKELMYYSCSQILIMQMKYLFLRIGILTSGNIKNNIGESHITKHGDTITTQQLSYCLRIPTHPNLSSIITFAKPGQYFKYFEWNGILWGRIKLIENTHYEGPVYDFNMIDNHNYLTDMGLVHNSGKRRGSIACYLEPWHSDILEFLDLRKNGGNEHEKCRDLFLALWVPDKFMRAVENEEKWYLMSEDDCPNLSNTYGEEFDRLYQSYVDAKKYVEVVDAKTIWQKIMASQMETGTPYIAYKDHINKKTNHQNLGTIKSSNLCIEIMEYSDEKEYAVCNLSSIAVNKFYNQDTNTYSFDTLHQIAKQATYNLNKIIDINYYPTDETRYSNLKNRPIGVGIQGSSDLLFLMQIPYESEEALQLSNHIMETIYHGCMEASNELAIKYGPYGSFEGSPLSQGKFQFDMWHENKHCGIISNDRYDWTKLRKSIMQYGVRNSLTTALMPTASTAQILGNTECFEPITSNLYSRLTLSGNFVVLNKYLQYDLMKLNLWNDSIINQITLNYGSIQNINEIPKKIKDVYKTVWEIKQKAVIDHAIRRGPFVDQSQSMNLYFATPDALKLRNALFYGWRNGIKTGMYYLRSQPAANAQQTILKDKKDCLMCSA